MIQLSAVIEAYLIASSDGLHTAEIKQLFSARYAQIREELTQPGWSAEEELQLQAEADRLRGVTEEAIIGLISDLNTYYQSAGRSFHIVETAFGWKIYTVPEVAPYLAHLFPEPRAAKLSQPALETLAIIAYRQPVTKAAIEAVRGVSSDAMVQKLIEADLIQVQGRADLPGRPLLYATTDFFYEHFGVRSIEDLPNSAELRNMAWPTASGSVEENLDAQLELGDFHQRNLEQER